MELPSDYALFLATICRYFHENGEWLTLRGLEEESLSRGTNLDVSRLANQLYHDMFGTYYRKPTWVDSELERERQIILTVPMIDFCIEQNLYRELREDLNAFVSLVRLCVSKYIKHVEPLTMTAHEAHSMLGMSELLSRKAFLLMELESDICKKPRITRDAQGYATGWDCEISYNIRVYREVQTIEDYLALHPKPPILNSGTTKDGTIHIVPGLPIYIPRGFLPTSTTRAQLNPSSAESDGEYKPDVIIGTFENSLQAVSRTRVFISYSHKDKSYLERLQVHLEPYRRVGMDIWDDTKIAIGQQWRQEIEYSIAATKVAILLVSADFLASKFIADNELPPLLAAAETDGAKIISVIVGACNFADSELSRFQAANPPSKPLNKMLPAKREEVWRDVARTVKNSLS